MPDYHCPHCGAAYSFDGHGVCACPSCGQDVHHAEHQPKPPTLPRTLSREAAHTLRALSIVAVCGVAFVVLLFAMRSENGAGSSALAIAPVLALVIGAVALAATWLFLPWLLLSRLREIRDELRKLNAKQ